MLEEEERVRGALDFPPRRHADLNGGLAPGAGALRPPPAKRNEFASCAR